MPEDIELELTVKVRLAHWMEDRSSEYVAWLIDDAIDNNAGGVLVLSVKEDGRELLKD